MTDLSDSTKHRINEAAAQEAFALIKRILQLFPLYPPRITLDFHEDEQLAKSYIYSQGALGTTDPVARRILSILQESGMPLQMDGETRFGEPIVDNIIGSVVDGSIDEMLSAETLKVDPIVNTLKW